MHSKGHHAQSHPVMIIGAGIAGLAAAKSLLDHGVSCVLVEKSDIVGGHVREWACMATDRCQRCSCCLVEDLADEVTRSLLAEVMNGCEVSSVDTANGAVPRVAVRQLGTGTERVFDVAALILATGFVAYDPSEKGFWGYRRIQGVYTMAEIDALIRQDRGAQLFEGISEPSIAFFQCVGSRDASIGANYCSQHCCKAALRMALKCMDLWPGLRTTIFYIDLQVAGKYAAALLTQAREKSVRLIQGVPGEIVPNEDGKLEVIVERDGRNERELFDHVVLSIGQRPSAPTAALVGLAGLEVDEYGFLASQGFGNGSRTSMPGVYVAGTCCGPKDAEQTVEHALQTAAAVMADLSTRFHKFGDVC